MITCDAVSQFTYIASAAENYFQKLPLFINKVTLESAVKNKNYGQIWINATQRIQNRFVVYLEYTTIVTKKAYIPKLLNSQENKLIKKRAISSHEMAPYLKTLNNFWILERVLIL